MKRGKRGFTLIELLVVIAIIGIIIGVLIVNIMAARSQSRDETRLENIASIQLALGLYFDKYGSYPAVIYCTAGVNSPTCLTGTIGDNFIASPVPNDPSGSGYLNNGLYNYVAFFYNTSVGTACTGYHLGTTLENNNANLSQASDYQDPYTPNPSQALCGGTPGGVSDFSASTTLPCGESSGTGYCYDIKK